MASRILNPSKIFPDIIADYREIFGKDLVGIFLYGSAAGPDYRPGKSDINFMIILSESMIDHMDRAIPMVKKWQKKGVAIPLFLTESYIKTSTDVFPIEYINFKHRYQVVYGKDLFKEISFEKEWIRLQCERELKGKLLLLRQALLETEGKGGRLKTVIARSLTSFFSIFRALIFLKDIKIPDSTQDMIQIMAREYGLDSDLFTSLERLKYGMIKLKNEEVQDLFRKYIKEIKRLSLEIDKLFASSRN